MNSLSRSDIVWSGFFDQVGCFFEKNAIHQRDLFPYLKFFLHVVENMITIRWFLCIYQ